MYHIIMSGIFVMAFKTSMKAKFATRKFGTVRRVLNRMSKRQMMVLPTIDPTITTVTISIWVAESLPRQRVTGTAVLFIFFLAKIKSELENDCYPILFRFQSEEAGKELWDKGKEVLYAILKTKHCPSVIMSWFSGLFLWNRFDTMQRRYGFTTCLSYRGNNDFNSLTRLSKKKISVRI